MNRMVQLARMMRGAFENYIADKERVEMKGYKWQKLSVLTTMLFCALACGKCGLYGAESSQDKVTYQRVSVGTAQAKAAAELADILAKTNIIPLDIYPPGHLDELKSIAEGKRVPLLASVYVKKRRTPGDKEQMSYLDPIFTMGSPPSENERGTDEGQHTAVITYHFYIGKYEVTQDEYEQVMGSNPSYFKAANGYTDDLDRPVENVTWAQAKAYCDALTAEALANGTIQQGWVYRLPTEAEWEYSCRGKTAQQVANGSSGKQPPHQVPWTNPSDGITYQHYWIGTSHSGYSPSGYVYYFNDSAPTVDVNEIMTTVGAIGYVGTRSQNSHESAWSNPGSLEQGVEFACSDVTGSIGACDTSGNGGPGEHWAWCPDEFFASDMPVRSSITHQLVYSPLPVTSAAYNVFSFGNALRGGYANFDTHYEYDLTGTVQMQNPQVNSLGMTTNVGSYAANGLGEYDMHGNVAEWCLDYYGTYPAGNTVDYSGPNLLAGFHVVRGGSWIDHGVACRSAARSSLNPNSANSHVGFRIVLAPNVPEWKTAVTTQPSIKTYGIPPTKTKNGLVLITHGYTGIFHDQSWIDSMSNSIVGYLNGAGVTDWQVYGYYWEPNSSTTSPSGALNNGIQEGISLGNSIVNQGWTKVHFIAHSAGASVIQVATEIIKGRAPSIVVQCTFLDPFVGFDYAGTTTYGNGADWSDRYSSHGDVEVAGGKFTDQPLNSAYNVDVTALDPSVGNSVLFTGLSGYAACSLFAASHGWAVQFYENTITGSITPDYSGFGFLLSKEAGGWPNAPTQYPVGNVNSVRVLGTQPQSCTLLGAIAATAGIPVDFTTSPRAAQSTSGTVTTSGGTLTLITGSPAWLSIIPTNTDPVSLLTFDANFTSTGTGAAGLLSVLWDSDTIGTLDERTIGQGVAHYSLHLAATESNSTHVLSFRLDPFTNVQSTVVITNVMLGQQGVTQPFSLSATTNSINGAIVWQLVGQAGFDYGLQVSTNLASTNWTQIAVLQNTNGVVNFSDQDSTNYPMRFYRAVAPY